MCIMNEMRHLINLVKGRDALYITILLCELTYN